MDAQFKSRYMQPGRQLQLMGSAVEGMQQDELYAVIGFLLERIGDDSRAQLLQEAPLGAPQSDPPKNDGLIEG